MQPIAFKKQTTTLVVEISCYLQFYLLSDIINAAKRHIRDVLFRNRLH